VGWQVTGQLVAKQAVIEEARQWLGRFIERITLNLSSVRLKIIRLFGPEVQNCYWVDS
jgi:hypothetical protein